MCTTNGLFQGCSLSFLCMNFQMCVWVLCSGRLESLTVKAFVDDAYIWSDI